MVVISIYARYLNIVAAEFDYLLFRSKFVVVYYFWFIL